jgi:aminoglycoside phosphotransferase (APT) family kinase protein
MVDLGWWLFLDDYHTLDAPRLPGLGGRAETIAMWEAGTGEKADDLHWYEVFAGFRFTVVMMRLTQMLEAYGVMEPNEFYNERNNPVSRLLETKLDHGPQ